MGCGLVCDYNYVSPIVISQYEEVTMVSRMERWARTLDVGVGTASHTAFVVATILGAVIVLGNAWEVTARYVFSKPTGFMDEILVYANIILIWLALGWGWRSKSHINVEVVVDRLHGRWHTGVTLAAMFIAFMALVGLSWSVGAYETDLAVHWHRPDTVLKTPWAIPHGLVALGVILFTLEVLLSLVGQIKRLSSKQETTLPETKFGGE